LEAIGSPAVVTAGAAVRAVRQEIRLAAHLGIAAARVPARAAAPRVVALEALIERALGVARADGRGAGHEGEDPSERAHHAPPADRKAPPGEAPALTRAVVTRDLEGLTVSSKTPLASAAPPMVNRAIEARLLVRATLLRSTPV